MQTSLSDTKPNGIGSTLARILPSSLTSLFFNARRSIEDGHVHGENRNFIYIHPITRETSLDVFVGTNHASALKNPCTAVLIDKKPNGTTDRETWKINDSTFECDVDRREQKSSRQAAFSSYYEGSKQLFVFPI